MDAGTPTADTIRRSGENWERWSGLAAPTIQVIEQPTESYNAFHERKLREDGARRGPFRFSRALEDDAAPVGPRRGATASEYPAVRRDGWPVCPSCGEDELYSLAVPATVETIVGCYGCSWKPSDR